MIRCVLFVVGYGRLSVWLASVHMMIIVSNQKLLSLAPFILFHSHAFSMKLLFTSSHHHHITNLVHPTLCAYERAFRSRVSSSVADCYSVRFSNSNYLIACYLEYRAEKEQRGRGVVAVRVRVNQYWKSFSLFVCVLCVGQQLKPSLGLIYGALCVCV